jgi:serine/threonine-protein kinase
MNEPDELVGQLIAGRYRVTSRIGEGGMGVVYRCRQMPADRLVAMKMLHATAEPGWVDRFLTEVRACAKLTHPNTIRIFDFGATEDGRLFMTMELLDGISLRTALAQGPIQPRRALKIVMQCAGSLAEAHTKGIIHRDIKPDNVFLLDLENSPDFVKLLDFSIAKMEGGMRTQTGLVVGTPEYMSPEHAQGYPLDPRSDVYALGIVAYEMVCGRVPFTNEDMTAVLVMQIQEPPPPLPPSIPPGVQQIIGKALAKNPAHRYQSAAEMLHHCQLVFADLNQGAVAVGAGGVMRTSPAAQELVSTPDAATMVQPPPAPPAAAAPASSFRWWMILFAVGAAVGAYLLVTTLLV